ncbi:MAG: hypothetical protein OXU77_17155 [Gammaproteobacteria bacterium]|nr:hypothetical protein [Gammaproteobacteria bacterium]MDE0443018.1 hypothetical protein [Gammaproteobacteria bacterium]
MTPFFRSTAAVCVTALVAACASVGVPKRDAVTDLAEPMPPAPSAAPSENMRSSVREAKKVVVPHDAKWLADRLTAEYRGLPASVAIRQVTQGRPVRLDVGGDDPPVESPRGATSIGEHVQSICRQADWSFSIVAGTMIVTDIETRTFPLAVQPGATAATMQLRSLAGGQESAAGNRMDLALRPYEEEIVGLVRTVAGIPSASRDGSVGAVETVADPRTSVVVLPSANAVVVTARPHVMRRVAREIERYNRATSQTVRLHVALYEVETSRTNDRGVDLGALRDSAGRFGFRVSSPMVGSGGIAELNFERIIGTHRGRAVLNWLRTVGRTSVSLDDVVEVRNNAVAMVDATETRQFVAQVSRQTEIAGPSQFATPQVEFDELRLGWSLALQPTVAEQAVTVRVALSRRELVDEQPYNLGDGAIQGTTYTTDDFNRVMSVALRSGETKLLTSLANSARRESTQRVPWLRWIGDGMSKARSEREVVLVMTAEVL